jgi:GT2 family glycosyltransferase
MLIRRDVFEEIGVFDETLREAGEDADLYRRMLAAKIAAWYTPRAISFHVIPAYRLKDEYLRWKAFRNGGHVARRNFLERGRFVFCALLVARLAQAMLVHWPRLVWAKVRRAQESAQNARCLLWRCEGYLRFALNLLAPKLFAQKIFFSSFDFRNEQQLFAHD